MPVTRPEAPAHRWARDVSWPTARTAPVELRGAVDQTGIHHGPLEHRRCPPERAQQVVGPDSAVANHAENALPEARGTLGPAVPG